MTDHDAGNNNSAGREARSDAGRDVDSPMDFIGDLRKIVHDVNRWRVLSKRVYLQSNHRWRQFLGSTQQRGEYQELHSGCFYYR